MVMRDEVIRGKTRIKVFYWFQRLSEMIKSNDLNFDEGLSLNSLDNLRCMQ